MFISTSNKNKIKEMKRFFPNIEIKKGKDLREVDGTMDEVIIYKALQGEIGEVVEDTILKIDGEEVVDIRWDQEEKLKDSNYLTWIVSYGYKTEKNTIKVYRGIVNGILVSKKCDGFGFDPYFLPDGATISLAELEKEGRKDEFSARTIASLNLLNDKFIMEVEISKIPKWTGKYQNS